MTLSCTRNGVARAEVERDPAMGGPFASSVAVSDTLLSPSAIDRLACEVAG